MFLDLFDTNISDERAQLFSNVAPSVKSLHTTGRSIVNLDSLINCQVQIAQDCLTELYLDMEGDDFRGDLLNFLQNFGSHLTILELKRSSLPIDISQLSFLCPNLKRLKVCNIEI